MRNYLKTIFSALLLAPHAFAADVQMSIQPQLISLLDRAVLKIEFIDTKGDAVDIPPVDGLQIQYQGQSSETRIVNFKSTSKIVHTYLVTPTKVGDYTIGPVTCKYKGGKREVSARLRVIKKANDQEAQQLSEIMFSHIASDRKEPYVHEPFNLDLKVYVRDGVQIDGNFSLRGGMPESGMDGELEWEVASRDREEHNGTIFNVYTLQTTAKTLTAGTFTFRPEVQVNIIVPRQRRRPWGFDDPFFGDFFGRQETRPIVLDCNTLQIPVQPIPSDNRPESFTGGVGVFDFAVDVGPTQVKAGEPITIKTRISGQGNINQIIPPVLSGEHDLKLYETRTLPSENPNEVRFEQVVIPKSGDVTEIPSLTFSYFNTQTEDFRTLKQGPFPVSVEPASQQAARVIATLPGATQQETEVLGRDIVYLKSAPKTWRMTAARTPWYHTRIFYVLLALPAMLLAATSALVGRHNTLKGDVARMRRQKAPAAARKQIQRAENALRKQDGATFHDALWAALADYFGHRLNLAPGEISLPVVQARIQEPDEMLNTLFSTIEQQRYGYEENGLSEAEMKSLLRELTVTLKKYERIKL
jgi:hypothetical protein